MDISADREADEDEHRKAIDDAYRAIGRYFVQFSRLVSGMRAVMSHRLMGEAGHQIELAELAFAGATAQRISDSLFAMCRYDGDLTETEQRICDALQTAVNEQIEWRNRFAHGDWWINPLVGDPLTPELLRATPRKRKGTPAELTHHPPREMDERSNVIIALDAAVFEFGALSLGLSVPVAVGNQQRFSKHREYRVEDVFTYAAGRSGRHQKKASVERNGPKAAEIVRITQQWPG